MVTRILTAIIVLAIVTITIADDDLYASCHSWTWKAVTFKFDYDTCYRQVLMNKLDVEGVTPQQQKDLLSKTWDKYDGRTLLSRAIAGTARSVLGHIRYPELVTYLLKKANFINLNAVDKTKSTALHIAVSKNNPDALVKLVELNLEDPARMSPDMQDNRRRTALHIAVRDGNVVAVKVLLKMKIDFSLRDEDNATALWLAETTKDAEEGNQIRSALLKGGAPPFENYVNGMNDIYAVCDKTVALRDNFYDYDSCYLETLEKKVEEKDISQFSYKWSEFNDSNILLRAIAGHDRARWPRIKYPQVVTYILKTIVGKGLDLLDTDKHNRTALHIAALRQNTAALEQLHSLMPPNTVDSFGRTALHYAVIKGDVKVVQTLLKMKNINLNLADKSHRTALHFASAFSTAATGALIRNELLDAGAAPVKTYFANMQDIYAPCYNSWNILLLAVNSEPCFLKILQDMVSRKDVGLFQWRWEKYQNRSILGRAIDGDATSAYSMIVEYLLKTPDALSALDLNEVDADGFTPLHIATYGMNLYALGLLLAAPAKQDLNARTHESQTAVHIAIMMGSQDALALLLAPSPVGNAPIDLSLTDSLGKTPMQLAQDKDNVAMIDLLAAHLKRLSPPAKPAQDSSTGAPITAVYKALQIVLLMFVI